MKVRFIAKNVKQKNFVCTKSKDRDGQELLTCKPIQIQDRRVHQVQDRRVHQVQDRRVHQVQDRRVHQVQDRRVRQMATVRERVMKSYEKSSSSHIRYPYSRSRLSQGNQKDGGKKCSDVDKDLYDSALDRVKLEVDCTFDRNALCKLLSDHETYSSNHPDSANILDNLLDNFIQTQLENYALVNCGRIYTVDRSTNSANGKSGPGSLGKIIQPGGVITIKNGKICNLYKSMFKFLQSRDNYLPQVDAEGSTVYPGFHDAHGHTDSFAFANSTVLNPLDARGLTSIAAVRAAIQDVIDNNPGAIEFIDVNGDLLPALAGTGYDESLWTDLPPGDREDKSMIDGFTFGGKDLAIIIFRTDGHTSLQNTAALDIISKLSFGGGPIPDPTDGIGIVFRDNFGEPTGVMGDVEFFYLITAYFPGVSFAEFIDALKESFDILASQGFTYIHEVGGDGFYYTIWKEFIDNNELPIKFSMSTLSVFDDFLSPDYDVQERLFTQFLSDNGFLESYGNLLTMNSIKLFVDGGVGGRSAYLTHEYVDDPGNFGSLGLAFFMGVTAGLHGFPVSTLVNDEERATEQLKFVMVHFMQQGFTINTHAIGNCANMLVINAYEDAYAEVNNAEKLRNAIEHVQYIEPEDRERMHDLKLIASMQPKHQDTDSRWVAQRTIPLGGYFDYDDLLLNNPNGFERASKMYSWKGMEDDGVVLAFGSDFPFDTSDWRLGFYYAITRIRNDQFQRPWLSDPLTGQYTGDYAKYDQRVSRERALRAFTRDAAYKARVDHLTGSIERGKAADLTLLDTDIIDLSTAPAEILTAVIMKTIVNGRIIYEN